MKKFFVHALLLAAFISSSFSLKAQTADEIIDKYIEAIGGKDNWKKVGSIKMDLVDFSNLANPPAVQ